MNSDKTGPDAPGRFERDIDETAKAKEKAAEAAETAPEAGSSPDLVDDLGVLQEGDTLSQNISDYVKGMNEGGAQIRRYRFFVTVYAAVVSVVLFVLVPVLVIWRPDWLDTLDTPPQAYSIIALIVSSSVLTTVLLRGVYGARHANQMDGVLAEAVKTVFER